MGELEDTLERVRNAIREWDRKKGHDRCWYYPEIFREIAGIVGIGLTNEPYMPTREQLEEGCRRYQDELYSLNVRIVPEEYKQK